MANIKFALASIFEDYVQIILQYFFFEKYLTGMVVINNYFLKTNMYRHHIKKAHDPVVYFNGFFMLVTSVLYLKTLVKGLQIDRDWKKWLLATCGVLGNKVNQR